MSVAQPAVSDLLVTAKSRELQRGMLAEMSGKGDDATPHFLAAAHLELVLADDYDRAGEPELGRRSRISDWLMTMRVSQVETRASPRNSLACRNASR